MVYAIFQPNTMALWSKNYMRTKMHSAEWVNVCAVMSYIFKFNSFLRTRNALSRMGRRLSTNALYFRTEYFMVYL